MRLRRWFLLGLLFLFICSACKKKEQEATLDQEVLSAGDKVFGPIVAGGFYPAEPKVLKAMVQGYLDKAESGEISGRILAVIAPHAGYIYSGPVAGYAYKAIQTQGKKKFVILAPSHQFYGPGRVAVLSADYYQTPLGKVKINREKVKELLNQGDWIVNEPLYFSQEHSAEVQIPFLQVIAPEGLELVILVMPDSSLGMAKKLADVLKKVFSEPDWVFIASTDMSHYHPYQTANQIDQYSLSLIQELKIEELEKEASGTVRKAELCGLGPVLTIMSLYQDYPKGEVKILNYRNSFDTSGQSPERVVGYGAVAFILSQKESKTEKPPKELSLDEKKELIRIAKLSVETYVKENRVPEVETKFERLKDLGAAFVTLQKQGELRGCIGHIIAQEPLYLCVREVACSAAKHDPRFSPVRKEELKELEYEISVLSSPERVKDLNQIQVGKDGLIMKKGYSQGVLLPQVPIEQGWNRQNFLSHTCLKAGMSPDCWQDSEVEVYSFQAEVFSEKELK